MRRLILLLIWLVGDECLFIGAYIAAYVIRIRQFNSTDLPLELFARSVLLVAPVWLIVMMTLRIYGLTRVQSSMRNIFHILFAGVMAASLVSLTHYFLNQAHFSRLLLVMAGAIHTIAVIVWHLAFDQWQRKILRRSPPAYPLLIIGANREAERLIKTLTEKQSVFMPVAILESRGTQRTEIGGVPVLGKLNKLDEVIREKKITHLAQCADLEHTLNLLSACRQHGITYFLLPSVLGIVEGDEKTELIEGTQPVTMVSQAPKWTWMFR